MNRKLLTIVIILLSLNLTFLAFLYARSTWITKINGEKISLEDFNEYYKAVLIFAALNSPLPISESQMNRILNDDTRRKSYLTNFENEYLVIKKAREKELYDESEINNTVQLISKVMKRQLILKEFYKKFIVPKIHIHDKQIIKEYKSLKKEGRIKDSLTPGLKEQIKQHLLATRSQNKFNEYTDKLRLESEIIRNKIIIKD